MFLAELKRRKVYRVATVYVVVGAGIIGLGEAALPSSIWDGIQIPVGIIVLVGLPIALVLAWAYEVRPEEPRSTEPIEEEPESGTVVETGPDVRATAQKKSIVVLPFDNMSPDPGDAYFADGLTEEIITNLSHIRSLRVISRNSAMVLKGTQQSTGAIAEELQVQYVLEGSVRKAGGDLRITAQLIEAENDAHIWAEKYDGSIGDVFKIQEKVSRSIVDALKVRISQTEAEEVSQRRIEDVQAYECYLKAYQEIFHYTEESFDRAVRLLKNGLELVGENELLYEAMGNAHLQQINFMASPDESHLLEAEKWAKKLLELNPSSSRGYFLDGLIQWKKGDWKEGLRRLKESLSLDQNNARTMEYLVYLHSLAGKGEKSREYLPKLLELEPLVPLYQCFRGWIDYMGGDFEAALGPIQKFYSMEPDAPFPIFIYSSFLTRVDRSEEAYTLIDALYEKAPLNSFAILGMLRKHALEQESDRVRKLVTPEFAKAARWDEQFSWEVAASYALIKEDDEGMRWLENAVNRGFINYPFLGEYDPFLENLRGKPPFKKLMDRVKHEWDNFEV